MVDSDLLLSVLGFTEVKRPRNHVNRERVATENASLSESSVFFLF